MATNFPEITVASVHGARNSWNMWKIHGGFRRFNGSFVLLMVVFVWFLLDNDGIWMDTNWITMG